MINHEAPHVLCVCVCVCVWGIDIVYKKTWYSCQIIREKKKKKLSIPLGYAIIYYVIEYPRYINNFI